MIDITEEDKEYIDEENFIEEEFEGLTPRKKKKPHRFDGYLQG